MKIRKHDRQIHEEEIISVEKFFEEVIDSWREDIYSEALSSGQCIPPLDERQMLTRAIPMLLSIFVERRYTTQESFYDFVE